MKYELAKELKDAGFPQRDRHFYFSTHTIPPTCWDINVIDAGQRVENEVAAPTLSELIAACGDKFALHKNRTHWKAWQINSNPRERNAADFEETGETPEEAVARLWIALQK